MSAPTEIDFRENKFSETFDIDPANNGTPQVIIVPKGEFTIVHLNRKEDGIIASVFGDDILIGSDLDTSFPIDYTARANKTILYPGTATLCIGLDVPKDSTDNDKRKIKILSIASTNKTKMLIVKGWFFYKGR